MNSIEIKAREYNYLLTTKEEQIKMLSSEIFISKQEKKKLKELELEIVYLKGKLKNYIENNKSVANSISNEKVMFCNSENTSGYQNCVGNRKDDCFSSENLINNHILTKPVASSNIFKRK